MEYLIRHIEDYAKLSEYEKENMLLFVKKRHFEKNEIIFSEGKIANEIYFVTKGCVRLFYNVDGKDRTAFFYTDGQFICAGESYTYNVPARENYQAIEKTEIYVFDKTNIEKLLEVSSKFELIARIATENELIVCQRIIASFVTKSAEERYIELLETNGELFQRVPQQYIASFLGVSPETLSRIKKRVLSKGNS
ncbi:cyclic nucleotide-binding domain-containing protein [Labilibaculum sp. A4]|uniref:Cyclic nucleotide-binding domain-containing protein n=1 Tax=Labilibaculum euxinus TaxID=2686357 RepID=A0A425Y171_9BACT|nr:Crp/Fnr family transcriptional regulator [Labilibaculum euxinus]MDQ1773026.1 Crp/Fnr family transcriptional regulator [Labilibaculum euxinus]MUP39165.1 cyclic nucleotide-binding domain-containing protein [Labilibaculum euxinus]MVB08370.1 cyclic nucleotide-binding domain-containing protein [Labilibaculum euxinus]MWN78437.1 cyclic nucleotide-binding domain-containing protein [Labilibaculum euxinus]